MRSTSEYYIFYATSPIGRAIVTEPRVLLFDEPLSNLDAKLREQMRVEVRRLQRRLKIASIYVTHDQAEAMALSDRIVVMEAGRVQQVAPPFQIYAHPANRFVADFIGRVNFLEGRVAAMADGTATVDIRGHRLEVPARGGTVRPADTVTIVVRPETIHVAAAAQGGTGGFPGRIRRAVYLGTSVEYEIEWDGGSLLAVGSNPPEGNHERAYEISRDFVGRFRAAFATTVCGELVGDLTRQATPEAEKERKARCFRFTLATVKACIDTLQKYERFNALAVILDSIIL
jgi:ABC-type Fe3+/spermidine/putrescine transport system ATPase subunit